jgi:hypothetical protein
MALTIECTNSSYQGLGGSYCTVKNEKAFYRAVVTAQGGRLIDFQYNGTGLIDADPAVFPKLPEVLAKERSQVSWSEVGIGGARTWVAPQSSYKGGVPFLDLNLGPYTVAQEESALTLTSPVCRETRLEVQRRIEFGAGVSAGFTTISSITNHSDQAQDLAPWEIIQTPVPVGLRICNASAEKPLVFSDFGNPMEKDATFALYDAGSGCWTLHFRSEKGTERRILPMFKLGFKFTGEAATVTSVYANHRGGFLQMINTFSTLQGPYPHFGPFEVFYNPDPKHPYVELEFLAPLKSLAPGKESEKLRVETAVYPR